ncbi:hypothetical protein AC1031_010731 [Aphanomyces cochlioides]|nr:hypothetical protein AC1031_010731 [Aphanomyces cochlioides]
MWFTPAYQRQITFITCHFAILSLNPYQSRGNWAFALCGRGIKRSQHTDMLFLLYDASGTIGQCDGVPPPPHLDLDRQVVTGKSRRDYEGTEGWGKKGQGALL